MSSMLALQEQTFLPFATIMLMDRTKTPKNTRLSHQPCSNAVPSKVTGVPNITPRSAELFQMATLGRVLPATLCSQMASPFPMSHQTYQSSSKNHVRSGLCSARGAAMEEPTGGVQSSRGSLCLYNSGF